MTPNVFVTFIEKPTITKCQLSTNILCRRPLVRSCATLVVTVNFDFLKNCTPATFVFTHVFNVFLS